jgi:hypothetical protein
MDILIDQPSGIGDLIFIQKLCSNLTSEGNKVFLPVDPFCWNTLISTLKSDAILNSAPQNAGDVRYINLSDQPKPNGFIDTMVSKYEGLGYEWMGWQDYVQFERMRSVEQNLKEHLVGTTGEPYIIVNKYYGTPPGHKAKESVMETVPKDFDGKIVDMLPDIGAPLYAWFSLLEDAEEIHSVDTSIHYICEVLNMNATRLVVHPRHPETSEAMVGRLFDRPWEWIR